MAGRQFSFFLAGSDQIHFEEALRSSGDIVFLESWPMRAQAVELHTSVLKNMGVDILNILICLRGDMSNVDFKPINERSEFSCDPVISCVIEFSRCFYTDHFIRAGRLFRTDKFWDDRGVLISKSDDFVGWAENLYKIARLSLTKVEQGCYAGDEAIRLRKSGVAFEGLDIEVGARG